MFKLTLTFILLSFISGTVHSDTPIWQKTSLGEKIIAPMENAPYPHETRETGYTSKSGTFYPKDPHYIDNRVTLFIPAVYKPQKKTDLVFFFHGHTNELANLFTQFDLENQVAGSGKNVILIAVQGPKNVPDSSCGKLEDPDGLKKLTEEILAFLNKQGKITTEELGNVVLMGHSGAYKVIGRILFHGGLEKHITDVYLLDASYGELEQYSDWVKRNPRARLISIFTAHLADENSIIMADLGRKKVRYSLVNDGNLNQDDLKKNRCLFIYTELEHNNVPHGNNHMMNFLMTSKTLRNSK